MFPLLLVPGWRTEVARSNNILDDAWHTKLSGFLAIIILEGCVAYQARRGAEKHEKRAQGQRPGKKQSQAATSKHAQAGQWQMFPGRELAKRPRQGLQNVPRQGTVKCSQAGNWQAFPGRELASVPGRDCKHAQAGHAHFQAFPGMGTGKRSRQGLQSNVPNQDTVKCSQAGNHRRPQAGDSGCLRQGTLGIAKEH